MAQQPFFYYSPESAQNRNQFHQMPLTPLPSTPGYGPMHFQQQMVYQPAPQYISQAMLTPAASPRQHHQKPMIMLQPDMAHLLPLDTECNYRYLPATPTLSSTGSFSSIESPRSASAMMPTPVNDYFGQTLEGVKQGCEEEVFSEILNTNEWASVQSPPLTPGTKQFTT